MELFVQQILAGLASGAIYALMALAVVMIYQTIHHLNFAQGEMAMFSTFVAWQLIDWGVPYWGAFVLTVALSFVGGLVIERVVFKPLRSAPDLAHIVVFIALFAIFNSLAGFIWDFTIKPFPTPFGSAPLLESGLISMHQAGMAAAIGAVAGLLIAPVVFLEPHMMLAILLYGFAGAVLGGLTSPGGAVLGGFAVGIVESLAGTYIPVIGSEVKLPIALALIVLVLLFKPSGLFGRASVQRV